MQSKFPWGDLLFFQIAVSYSGMEVFRMETLGYYNGKIGEIADIMVPMDDRACYEHA